MYTKQDKGKSESPQFSLASDDSGTASWIDTLEWGAVQMLGLGAALWVWARVIRRTGDDPSAMMDSLLE